MSHPEQTKLPDRLTVGDLTAFTQSLPDYPADESWVLTYSFTNRFANFQSTHAANGADHDITIDTSDLEPGDYNWTAKVVESTNIHTIASGRITVAPDLSADTAGVDRREYARIALENIEAVLQGKASKDQTSYSLNGRALSRYSPDELNAWRAALRIEVADLDQAERIASGGKSHRNVRVRFNSDSV